MAMTQGELKKSPVYRKKLRLKHNEIWFGYLLIAPVVIGYLLFQLGPIVAAFGMSFTNWALFMDTSFVGLANYEKILLHDKSFQVALKNTLVFSMGLVPLNLLIALSLALLLSMKLRGIGIFRTLVFTPVVTSLVAWAIVWKYIFNADHGFLNVMLKSFGIAGPNWLYDFHLAMPAVIVVSVLKNVGINMVIYLAALNDVPQMYYEAAKIDGASRWKSFLNVTLPLISPAIFLTGILTTIGSLKVFGQIYIMTGGGPGNSTKVLVYYIFEKAFKLYQFGYASAVAFVLFAIVLVITVIQWNVRKRWIHYEQ